MDPTCTELGDADSCIFAVAQDSIVPLLTLVTS